MSDEWTQGCSKVQEGPVSTSPYALGAWLGFEFHHPGVPGGGRFRPPSVMGTVLCLNLR